MADESLPPLHVDAPDGPLKDQFDFTGYQGKVTVGSRGYAAGKRLHALAGPPASGQTLYGQVREGIVTRDQATWVASEWLVKGKPGLLATAKELIKQAGAASIKTVGLQLDDAELLGTSKSQPKRVSAEEWEAGVVGALQLRILGTTVDLRPERMSFGPARSVIFTESKSSPESSPAGGGTLTVRWKCGEYDATAQRDQTTLQTKAAMLLDQTSDGGWETGAPLWIRTTEGCLRWDSPSAPSLSYQFLVESRTLDITSWLPAVPNGGFARLLLDRSGDKKLTIDAEKRLATLEVTSPAILVAVPRSCCDGSALVAPSFPPDDASVDGTLCIVSQALAPSNALCMTELKLLNQAKSDLVIEVQRLEAGTRYFEASGNWVRPVECSVNSPPGISRTRVLLPHKISSKFKLRLRGSLVAERMPEAKREIDLDQATRIDPNGAAGTAPDRGPLARFDVRLSGPSDWSGEMWHPDPSSVPNTVEPVVLRALYRRSSASGTYGPDAALPPYTATLAHVAAAAAVRSTPRRKRPKQQTWHEWVDPVSGQKQEALRWEQTSSPLRRGWVHGTTFIGRGTGLPGPIDLLEIGPAGEHVQNWLRLSNDTLIPRSALPLPADAGKPLPEDPAFYTAATQAIHADVLRSDLGAGLGSSAGTLALLVLEEQLAQASNGQSIFRLTLKVEGQAEPIAIAFERQSAPLVNRLVIVAANTPLPDGFVTASPDDDGALVLKRLNRLYLELERDGPRFVVRRGMLGWHASGAFGLTATDEGLEVTELFERSGGNLSRRVEFNGGLVVVKEGTLREGVAGYSLTVYFWAASWEPQRRSHIRVVGRHTWKYDAAGKSVTFISVQDARAVARRLDLSADLVLLGAGPDTESNSSSAGSTWAPTRRALWAELDASRETADNTSNEFIAFVKIRHGDASKLSVERITDSQELRLIPDWRASERDIVPWFSDVPRPARPRRTTWLREESSKPQALAARAEDVVSQEIEVVVTRNSEAPPGTNTSLLTCCLVGSIDQEPGIPQWVPSPLRQIKQLQDVPVTGVPMSRLWLFDGPPRMVAERAGAEDLKVTVGWAQASLARMGWTREAVLEVDPGTGPKGVQWKVVDSPLLNREASIGWFAWPLQSLGDNDQPTVWPRDVLPRTRPVPQVQEAAPRAFGIECAFADDVDPATGQAEVPTLHFDDDVEKPTLAELPLKLRSAGLRAGAAATLLDYGADSIGRQVFASVPLQGPTTSQPLDTTQEGRLSWAAESFEEPNVTLSFDTDQKPDGAFWIDNLEDDVVLVKVLNSGDGLMLRRADNAWSPVDPEVYYETQVQPPGRRLGIKMLEGRPFRTIVLALYKSKNELIARRSWFDGGVQRLAGIFDPAERLHAFGPEVTTFKPNVQGDPPRLTWQRSVGWQSTVLPGGQSSALTDWYVVTIDLEGRFTLYR